MTVKLDKLTDKIENIECSLSSIRTDIAIIKKALDGNGQPGLLIRVANNEKWRYVTTGGIIILTSLVSYGVIKLW